jgi:hypothetical protein
VAGRTPIERRKLTVLRALALVPLLVAALAAPAVAAVPAVTTGPAAAITATSATLTGKVNPNNLPTTYFFRYGKTRAYGTQTPTQGPTAAVKQNLNVSAAVAGLTPGATYHFQLVATNSSGTKRGGDHAFTTPPLLSLTPRPEPIVFGRSVLLSGQLFSAAPGGVTVTLKENPFPFAGFVTVATTRTDSLGRYSFGRAPGVNTRYMVVASTRPNPVSSASRTVFVQIRLTLGVSTTRPRRGQAVAFSGFAAPFQTGRLVLIERLVGRTWRIVGHARLRGTGTTSRYRTVVHVFNSGLYRAHVGHDASHSPGTSVARRLRLR